MTEVYFTHRAEADLDEAYGWYAARSLETTGKWLDALAQVVSRLEVSAGRFPAAIEDQDFPIELRQATFGGGRKATHRVVFAIRPDRVVVHAIRHLAQRELTLDDLV